MMVMAVVECWVHGALVRRRQAGLPRPVAPSMQEGTDWEAAGNCHPRWSPVAWAATLNIEH